jgi:hypothetical protein
MAIQKRKAVAKSVHDAFSSACGKGTKRAIEEAPAAEPEEEPEQPGEHDVQDDAEEEISQEARLAREEESVAAARRKELKAMAAADLKQMVAGKGLEQGNKEENVTALLALEAKARADQRAHEARLRAVVVRKKEELEALPSGELAECCRVAGVLGRMTKQDRVQQLMARWQQDDGIAKGLAAMALEERHAELAATELPGLLELCAAAGVDPLLREVMVDRLVKHEVATGRFARPQIPQDEERDHGGKGVKADLVDAVLANESSRKKQLELKKKQEEAEAKRRSDLQSKSIDDLKKLLAGKGQEATGKKNELVERLMLVTGQEESLAARRAKLRALGVDELRRMLTERKVETQEKGKDAMINAIFEHEIKAREELEAFSTKVVEAEAKKKEELQARSATELKEMCAAKGLKLGVAKDDRVATLVEAAGADGEIEKLVAASMRSSRTDELLAMDKGALKALCDQAGVDALVKDIVVERILSHESEHGRIAAGAGEPDGKPPAKKARSSKRQ